MAILSSEILGFVNETLSRAEASVDTMIADAAVKLSDEALFLEESTTFETSADKADYTPPSDNKAVNTLKIQNGDVLDRISWRTYQENAARNYMDGLDFWTEWGGSLYLQRSPQSVMTIEVSYFKLHPRSVSLILFGEAFRDALNFNTAYRVALKYRMFEAAAQLKALYQAEVGDLRTKHGKSIARQVRYKDMP